MKRRLTGNLDRILLKSLDKDPARRYRSVRQFSDDLGLHLAGLSVRGRLHAFATAAGEFAIRNSLWLILAFTASAAMYSGILRVPPTVALEAVAWATALGLAYWILFGVEGRTAARLGAANIIKILIVGVCATVVALIAWDSSPDFLTLSRAVPAFTIVLCIGMGLFQLRWRRRERCFGSLAVEIDPVAYSKLRTIFSVCCFLAAVGCGVIAWIIRDSDATDFALATSFAALFFAMGAWMADWTRVEIRQGGVAGFGGLLPWSAVIAYSWEPGGGMLYGEFDWLCLNIKGVHRLWGPFALTRFRVPVADRDKLNATLEQQFFEWPDTERPPIGVADS